MSVVSYAVCREHQGKGWSRGMEKDSENNNQQYKMSKSDLILSQETKVVRLSDRYLSPR